MKTKKYVEGTDMLCPVCKHNLSIVDQRNYETLNEHVCSPNDTPSPKDGYGCTNPGCLIKVLEMRWLFDGEGPFTPRFILDRQFVWNKGIQIPKGTWHYEYALHRKRHKDWTFRLTLKNYMLDFELLDTNLKVWKREDEFGFCWKKDLNFHFIRNYKWKKRIAKNFPLKLKEKAAL